MENSLYSSNAYYFCNKDMHSSDSFAKAKIISRLIRDHIILPYDKPLSILEVGGGAGLVSYHTCNQLLSCKFFPDENSFVLHSLEPSSESVNLQKHNNKFISSFFNCSLNDYQFKQTYDCILLIDVLEHIPDKDSAIHQLSLMTDNLIVNLPLEHTLFDHFRNFFSNNRYFQHQINILGHVHRFNYHSARHQFKKLFRVIHYEHWPYFKHLFQLFLGKKIFLTRKRLLELYISKSVNRFLPFFSPYIVQGSTFIFLKSKF